MISFTPVAPTLVINDETGEFIMTDKIEYIRVYSRGGSEIFLERWAQRIISPISPKELRDRLFLSKD